MNGPDRIFKFKRGCYFGQMSRIDLDAIIGIGGLETVMFSSGKVIHRDDFLDDDMRAEMERLIEAWETFKRHGGK